MNDFKGKIIKICLNSNTGYVCETGAFIDMKDDFVVIKNIASNKIQYISKFNIKYIEIIKEIGGNSYE